MAVLKQYLVNLFADVVIAGTKTIAEIPESYRAAVQAEIDKRA